MVSCWKSIPERFIMIPLFALVTSVMSAWLLKSQEFQKEESKAVAVRWVIFFNIVYAFSVIATILGA